MFSPGGAAAACAWQRGQRKCHSRPLTGQSPRVFQSSAEVFKVLDKSSQSLDKALEFLSLGTLRMVPPKTFHLGGDPQQLRPDQAAPNCLLRLGRRRW